MSELTSSDQRALRAVGVQFWVNGVVVASYVPRLPGIRDRLELDLATIGTLIAVATATGLVGSIGVGPAVDRFGTKQVMLGGALALVFALPFVSVAPSALSLLVVLAVIAASDVFTDVAMNIQGSVLSARRRVPVMNRLHAMWSLGTVVGGLISAAMAAWNVDLRIHLVGASAFLLCALVYVAPGLLSTDQRHDDNTTTPPTATTPTSSIVVMFGLLGAAAIVPEMINSDWAAFRLTDDLGASEALAGIAYVSFTAGMVAGRLAGDTAVDRFGGRVILQRATLLAAIGIVLATLVPVTAAVFVGLFLAGSGVSVMFPQLYDAAARAPRSGQALGALTAGSRIALLIAPLLVGVLADTDALDVGAAIAITTVPAALLLLVLSSRLQTD